MNKSYVEQYLHAYHELPTGPLPILFDFPHQYVPNEWAQTAARQLQEIIPNTFAHNFETLGKMFGVLVVNTPIGIRFLAGFSGKIDESNQFPGFVPPIYDTLNTEAFFKQGEAALNDITNQINEHIDGKPLSAILQEKSKFESEAQERIANIKKSIKVNKELRDTKRKSANLSTGLEVQLANESKQEQLKLKKFKKEISTKVEELNAKIALIQEEITALKTKRTNLSINIQQELFKAYNLLNFKEESSTVLDVFKSFNGDIPPSGTGECALPKLLHFAATHHLSPICFAEFWWGTSPIGEVRKHGMYYPACRAKCEPLLHYLLRGIPTMKNPVLEQLATKTPETIFEDSDLLIVNKPSGMLSVPGRTLINSAEDLLKLSNPSFPYLKAAHRLDMGTSGILIFAKNAEAHAKLQGQFQKQKVKKIYEAILDGVVEQTAGNITLPLRLNTDHRPHQMVDFEQGKKANTAYRVLEITDGKTHIEFYPTTGRTHQLRVHSAHPLGLNCPIVGDELYGTSSNRLYLHAKEIEFQHPTLQKNIVLTSPSNF